VNEWKPSDLPKLALRWTCSACGVDEQSGRSCRIIPIDGAVIDEVVCSACDHDCVERVVRESRQARDDADAYQRELVAIGEQLSRLGVQVTAGGLTRDGIEQTEADRRFLSLSERITLLARSR
jgi:hypothetical protein